MCSGRTRGKTRDSTITRTGRTRGQVLREGPKPCALILCTLSCIVKDLLFLYALKYEKHTLYTTCNTVINLDLQVMNYAYL